jgi:hypothetical protein
MYAVKGNRQYTISEANVKQYQQDGYDILSDDGKTVIAHGVGKTVLYDKYEAVCKELEALKSTFKEPSKSEKELKAQVKALTEENETLKAKAQENQPDDSGDEFK